MELVVERDSPLGVKLTLAFFSDHQFLSFSDWIENVASIRSKVRWGDNLNIYRISFEDEKKLTAFLLKWN